MLHPYQPYGVNPYHASTGVTQASSPYASTENAQSSGFSPNYTSSGNTNVNVGNGNINNSFNNNQINIINVNSNPATAAPSLYYPTQQPQQNVASNEVASIWGDPHVDPAHVQQSSDEKPRQQYDFMDGGMFNLLSDKNVSVNGNFSGGDGSTMTEAGLNLGDDKLDASVKNGKISINGQDASQGLQLGNGTTVQALGDKNQGSAQGTDQGNGQGNASDNSGAGALGGVLGQGILGGGGNGGRVRISNQNSEYDFELKVDGGSLDLKAISKNQGVRADGMAPTGILGETFNHGQTGGTDQNQAGSPPSVNGSAPDTGSSPITQGGDNSQTSGNSPLDGLTPTTQGVDNSQGGGMNLDPAVRQSNAGNRDQKSTRFSHDHYKVQGLFGQPDATGASDPTNAANPGTATQTTSQANSAMAA